MPPETLRNPALPSFTDAVATFAAFPEREGAPAQLLWVDREDVTSHRRQIWARVGDPGEARRRAQVRYEAARETGLGVSLRAVCKIGMSTACYVWTPKDEVHASYAMQPRSLKCQVPVPLLCGSVVRSSIWWRLRRAINSVRQFGNTQLSELPCRVQTVG